MRFLLPGLVLLVVGQSLATGGAGPQAPQPLAIRFAPDGDIYLAHENRNFGVVTVQVQNIAIVNDLASNLRLENVSIEILTAGRVVLMERHTGAAFDARWQRLKAYLDQPGVRLEEEARFRFAAVLGTSRRLSASADMDPRSVIYLSRRFFTLDPVGAEVVAGRPRPAWPDTLRVTAGGRDANGGAVRAEAALRIVNYEPRNRLVFPVRGRWYVAASSSLRSHHRTLPVHEFALDLLQIGLGGRSHNATVRAPGDYVAFGEPVLAMASGTVVAVQNDVPETRVRRADESVQDYRRQVLNPLAASGGYATSAGNYIVLEHPRGEYSTYAHLQTGSVRVRAGDRVAQGQSIASVGFSGDGFEPHLHVQLTDGPDANLARGLPLVFTNVRPVLFSSTTDLDGQRQLQAGEFIDTVE